MPEARAALRTLGVGEIPLPPAASVRLAQLRADTGLRLPDCAVLLAAEMIEAAVATFDRRLAEAAGRIGVATA